MTRTVSTAASAEPSNPSPSPRGAASPLHDAAWMARLIGSVTGETEETVLRRLKREYDRPGSSVAEDFAKHSLPRYTWSEGLIRFYGQTDAFIYELAVWNRNKLKAGLRQFVVRRLNAHAKARPGGRALRVLSIGDGLGFDSLAMERAGNEVVYFELPGRSEAFARRLFAETDSPVSVMTDLSAAGGGSFDAVVCLDVLEHAPDPPAEIARVVTLLRPGGLAFFSAPFFLILPQYPTHLKTNRHHSGSLALYRHRGLRLIDGSWGWAPLVFEKPDPAHPAPRNWLNVLMIHVVGVFLCLGRFVAAPFILAHAVRCTANRWFTSPAHSAR